MRSKTRRFCSYIRRFASVSKSSRASTRATFPRLSIFAAAEAESRHQGHSGFPVRRFPADRLRPASNDQSPDRGLARLVRAGVSPANSKSKQPTRLPLQNQVCAATFAHRAGLTLCENRGFALDFYLRSRIPAGRNFSRNRFGRTSRLSAKNGRSVLASPISSGRYGHLTKTGSFKILEKERTHYSSMYGKIVDARGNTIVADAHADMAAPRGSICRPARWPTF